MLPKGSIAKVGEYYFSSPEHEGDVFRAFREFFNRPDLHHDDSPEMSVMDEGLFNEWFLYDFVLSSGETVLAHFVGNNPLKISKSEMALYRELLKHNTYGIFEVKRVDVGVGLELENMQTDEKQYVYEQSLTYQARRGNVFFGRIGKVGDRDELIGADTFSLAGVDERFKRALRKGHLKLTPKIAYEFLRLNSEKLN